MKTNTLRDKAHYIISIIWVISISVGGTCALCVGLLMLYGDGGIVKDVPLGITVMSCGGILIIGDLVLAIRSSHLPNWTRIRNWTIRNKGISLKQRIEDAETGNSQSASNEVV